MDSYNLVQTIQDPTRKENMLYLVFTNNNSVITHIEVTGTIMSDHELIELSTNIRDNDNQLTNSKKMYIWKRQI